MAGLFAVGGNFALFALFVGRFGNRNGEHAVFKIGFGVVKFQFPGQRNRTAESAVGNFRKIS